MLVNFECLIFDIRRQAGYLGNIILGSETRQQERICNAKTDWY